MERNVLFVLTLVLTVITSSMGARELKEEKPLHTENVNGWVGGGGTFDPNPFPTSGGLPSTGLPTIPGLPSTGLPSTGLPTIPGLPSTGLPSTGLPTIPGLPSTGLPSTGLPSTGLPSVGLPGFGGVGGVGGVGGLPGLPGSAGSTTSSIICSFPGLNCVSNGLPTLPRDNAAAQKP